MEKQRFSVLLKIVKGWAWRITWHSARIARSVRYKKGMRRKFYTILTVVVPQLVHIGKSNEDICHNFLLHRRFGIQIESVLVPLCKDY